ncbi:MAG: NAD(P)-dependent oxidoreductase [Carbonactinosporaceae bacterium]
MTIDVGLVGVGAMGSQLARRLAGGGFSPLAFDEDLERVAAVDAVGGIRAATSLRELGGCDIVITMLPDGAAVRAVVLGGPDAGGLAGLLRTGATVVDMSSSAPEGTVELARLLRGQDLHLLDAPVSGGTARAASGTLSIMVGGHEGDLARCRPVLEVLGSQIFHTGPVGSGHALKALNNMLSAAGLTVALEVMAVGQRFGLDPCVMLAVLNASTGRNNSTENKIAQQVLSRAFAHGFATKLMVKDLTIAVDLAHHTGTPVPVSAACLETWKAALQEVGGEIDHTAIARYIEQRAGVILRAHTERSGPATPNEGCDR